MFENLFDIKFNYGFGRRTWFGSGGNSTVFFKIDKLKNLKLLLKILPKKIPLFVIGAGSNIIVRDGGFRGIVLKLGEEFNKINIIKNESIIKVGSAVKDSELSKFCEKNNIGDFEFINGIPGTVGGNIKMNAGCFGKEISNNLVSCTILNRKSEIITLSKDQIDFQYRKTNFEKSTIILSADFKFSYKEKNLIIKKKNQISNKRKKTQPFAIRTGGSTFTNPNKQLSAWKLIDKIGYRGRIIGGAQVSSKHSNFLVNFNKASSLDIELLGEEIREKIKKKFKIKLDWEIERIGKFKKI